MDMEGNGLNPDKLHVLSVSSPDGKVKKSTPNYDDMRKFFSNAKVIIGHHITRFDVPIFERILDIKIDCKIIDTLALSWVLFPTRSRHGLGEWGEEFGVPKPKIDDWDNLTYEEYKHRCEEDVEINRLLWDKMYKLLFDLYGSKEKIWEFLDYISFKMYCARLQEKSGWHVDIDRATKSLDNMIKEREIKRVELISVMPSVPQFRIKEKPKVFFKKDGNFSKHAMEWNDLLASQGLPGNHEDVIKIWTHDEPPNPGSVSQVKDWLYSLGWVPQTYKTVKNKITQETKQVPQVSLEQTKELCPSVVQLIDKEPKLKVLEGLTTLSARIATLRGIVESVDDEGKTMAQVQGLTNTLRFQHATIVNLPKAGKLWAVDIRGSLIASPGNVLCGSDMTSLEDKIKQHYIYEYDPDYVESLNQKGYDPHLTIAVMGGLMSVEDKEFFLEYKDSELSGNMKSNFYYLKGIRDTAKTTNYALQYQAGIARLMLSAGIDRATATKLFNAYWKLNWAIKKVASVQIVKTVGDQMWLKNPINGFYYSLRYMKDVFSTLVQGTASYVFDMWLKYILEKRPQLTGQFHDEIILNIKEGSEEKCRELITYAINKLNETIKLNRELGVDIQFSKSYGNVH